jgi:hypothetical protein
MNWNVTLGSAIAGGTAAGTATGLYDTVVIGAAMVFDWGSGGTAGTAWLQTSPDGTAWFDAVAFSFGTVDANRYAVLGQPSFGTSLITPTDATATGGAVSGIPFGDNARLRYSNVGTYAGTTTLNVYLISK